MQNGTVRKMTDGQRSDLIATMAGAMPADLSFEEAQEIIGKKGSFVAEIRQVFLKRRIKVMPADNEWFEMEVDYNIDPMAVVASAGYQPQRWKYIGPKVLGKRALRVKLIRLGFVSNLFEAINKVEKLGYSFIAGEARDSFATQFPKPDGKGPVVFGGSMWRDPAGTVAIASLYGANGKWSPVFEASDAGFDKFWRWLVTEK